ncbi:MAG: hypothetical protein IJF73_07160 [Clostridia bacterium]|nr:hypothetical protein [Clostridia bacterium]
MSKNNKRTYLLYLLAAPIVAAVAIVLRSVALLSDYDAALGYFDGRALPIAMAALLVTVIAVLAVLTHELRGFFVATTDYRDLPTLFSGIYLGIALVFFGVTLAVSAIGSFSAPLFSPVASVAALLAALSLLCGAGLFAVRAFDGRAVGPARAMLTLAPAVGAVLYTLYLHLDPAVRINEPNKMLAAVAWIAVAFFFLGEARIALLRAKWALHTYVTAVTVMLSATLCLPNLLYEAVHGTSLLGSTAADFAMLGVFLYATARLVAAYLAAIRAETAEGQYITDFTVTREPLPTEEDAPTDSEEDSDEEALDR